MTESISIDTAIALKAAGYPQPELQIGQFWYEIHEEPMLCVVVESYGYRRLFFRKLELDLLWCSEKHLTVYAPGASELLMAVGTKIKIYYESEYSEIFVCDNATGSVFPSKSAAEALAQEWLFLKKRNKI